MSSWTSFLTSSGDARHSFGMTDNFPRKCCKNVGLDGYKACGKPAWSWYWHGVDLCSYCEEHDYVCGTQVVPVDGNLVTRLRFAEGLLKEIRSWLWLHRPTERQWEGVSSRFSKAITKFLDEK